MSIIISLQAQYQMSYCQSQMFSPSSLVFSISPDQTNMSRLVDATQYIFWTVILYIIYKMCRLCSKAFSYSNFHIHEAYKFYILALISTITILASRTIQIQLASKINKTKSHPDDEVPFRKNPYYQGWIIFNEIIGIISVYSVDLVYVLTALTWLMIAKKCDFNSKDSRISDDYDDEEQLLSKHKFYTRLRLIILYFFIPVCMFLSIVGQLRYSKWWCLSSRIILSCISTFVFLFFVYSIIYILLQRWGDRETPLKIKLIWCYMIFALTFRQVCFWIMQVDDFSYPTTRDYLNIKGRSKLVINVLIFIYSILVTSIPIFSLSYLADKQLQTQKSELDRSQRIIYTSSII